MISLNCKREYVIDKICCQVVFQSEFRSEFQKNPSVIWFFLTGILEVLIFVKSRFLLEFGPNNFNNEIIFGPHSMYRLKIIYQYTLPNRLQKASKKRSGGAHFASLHRYSYLIGYMISCCIPYPMLIIKV